MSRKFTIKTGFLLLFFLLLNIPLLSVLAKESGDEFFKTSETTDGVSISNGSIGIKFSSAEDGFGLKSITKEKGNFEFLSGDMETNSLWSIEFKHSSNRLLSIDNTVDCERSYNIEKSQDGNTLVLHLHWNGITLDTEDKVVNVHATVKLDETSFSRWRINVENNSRRFGTWEVTYPLIKGLKGSEKDDMELAYSDFHGRLLKNPVKRIPDLYEFDPKPPLVMDYPSARCTMQFSTLFEGTGHNGLYLATHDSAANVKKFGYDVDDPEVSLKYWIRNYPKGMGIPGSESSYEMPYDIVIGVYEGDWITAAKIYRSWVTDQKWCEKGKLSGRKDIPEWYLNTQVWFAGTFTDKMIPLAKYLDVNVAFQWYRWHAIPFDVNYPDYFPTIPEFPGDVERLQAEGIRIVPYINSRLWDMNSDSWKREQPYSSASRVPANMFSDLVSYSKWPTSTWKDLMMYVEHWGSSSHVIMCPYTKVWQNKQSDIVSRLVDEYHVDGVYMDQTASCMPVYCFDASHGHPVGGGSHWIDGNRKLVEYSKANARKANSEAITTTEDFAEPYIDVFDGLLACNASKFPFELIPMFNYVYSDYCITFGRFTNIYWERKGRADIYASGLAFMMRNAQMYLWGEQLGWFDPDAYEPGSKDMEYLKTLCKSLENNSVKKYLVFGEMVRPPELSGDNPVLSAAWRINQEEAKMNAVSHSAWKAEDGTLGLVFTNLDGKKHKIRYNINAEDFDLPHLKEYSARIIDGNDEGKVEKYDSGSFERVENMAPYSVRVIEIKAN